MVPSVPTGPEDLKGDVETVDGLRILALSERLMSIIEKKRKGETIKVPDSGGQPTPAPDLMAALEQTLEELKQGGSGRWSESRKGSRIVAGLKTSII